MNPRQEPPADGFAVRPGARRAWDGGHYL